VVVYVVLVVVVVVVVVETAPPARRNGIGTSVGKEEDLGFSTTVLLLRGDPFPKRST